MNNKAIYDAPSVEMVKFSTQDIMNGGSDEPFYGENDGNIEIVIPQKIV